jgi:hypothetical protein
LELAGQDLKTSYLAARAWLPGRSLAYDCLAALESCVNLLPSSVNRCSPLLAEIVAVNRAITLVTAYTDVACVLFFPLSLTKRRM